uniref:Uncharacterized protein n=1 Tax=Tetranychus urticae TaxID=32264 RepID=T1K0D0_TETUR
MTLVNLKSNPKIIKIDWWQSNER